MDGVPTGRQQIVFMQHANAWSMNLVQLISAQYMQAGHAALYRRMVFCWWKPKTRGTWQRTPGAQDKTQQFILTFRHTKAASHMKRNSMMQNALASWGDWTSTARGGWSDRKKKPSLCMRKVCSRFFCGAAGTCQGQSLHVSISNWSISLCPVPITLW